MNCLSERLERGNVAITDTIKHNKEQKMVALNNDCSLFSRLYIACQARESNLEEFFQARKPAFPTIIVCFWQINKWKKSELIDCLQTASQHTEPVVDLKATDGAAAVHIFTPTTACKTFHRLCRQNFFAVCSERN